VDLRVLDRLEFELEDGRIVWTRVPSHGLPAQLDALRELMAERPVYEPTLPSALSRVREAMEFVLETESDVDVDTFEEIILGLVERLEGFSVWSHGVFDESGRSLIDLYDPPPETGAAPAERFHQAATNRHHQVGAAVATPAAHPIELEAADANRWITGAQVEHQAGLVRELGIAGHHHVGGGVGRLQPFGGHLLAEG
jgi:hypothetical protein